METPKELMSIARAQIGAARDRDWLNVELYHADIERIAADGPSTTQEDQLIVRLLANVVNMELYWRKIERSRMEQGEVSDE